MGSDLDAIDPDDAARALLLWSNSPSNPTGGLGDLGAEAAWGRAHGVPVFSDECYAEFTWDGPPRSVLQHGPDGVVAVHSLSKRSNLAGVRVGFYAGDAELVEFLRAVRQHAGLMVPGPAQAAGVAALGDDEHVEGQRARYRERLAYLAGVLDRYGCPVAFPEGGFYLWVPVPEGRWPDALGHGRGAGERRRHPGQPRRPLRRGAGRMCGSPSSSRWSGWRWWGSASLTGTDHRVIGPPGVVTCARPRIGRRRWRARPGRCAGRRRSGTVQRCRRVSARGLAPGQDHDADHDPLRHAVRASTGTPDRVAKVRHG